MKCIRAFADNRQAGIILYIIYQTSPITDRSVIRMLSSMVWFFKKGMMRAALPVLYSRGFSFTGTAVTVLSYFSPV